MRATRIAIVFMGLIVLAPQGQAAEAKRGFSVRLEREGFFLNPLVKRLFVEEVTKGSLAEAAGMRAGDEIVKIKARSLPASAPWRFRGS